jgi:hypothetical protein
MRHFAALRAGYAKHAANLIDNADASPHSFASIATRGDRFVVSRRGCARDVVQAAIANGRRPLGRRAASGPALLSDPLQVEYSMAVV